MPQKKNPYVPTTISTNTSPIRPVRPYVLLVTRISPSKKQKKGRKLIQGSLVMNYGFVDYARRSIKLHLIYTDSTQPMSRRQLACGVHGTVIVRFVSIS